MRCCCGLYTALGADRTRLCLTRFVVVVRCVLAWRHHVADAVIVQAADQLRPGNTSLNQEYFSGLEPDKRSTTSLNSSSKA